MARYYFMDQYYSRYSQPVPLFNTAFFHCSPSDNKSWRHLVFRAVCKLFFKRIDFTDQISR